MPIMMPDQVTWAYTVTVRNSTTDVFDDLVLFYKTKGQAGVTYLHSGTVMPGEAVPFALGPCGAMESYAIGFFIGNDMVATFPS